MLKAQNSAGETKILVRRRKATMACDEHKNRNLKPSAVPEKRNTHQAEPSVELSKAEPAPARFKKNKVFNYSLALKVVCEAWPSLFPERKLRPVKVGILDDMIGSEAAKTHRLRAAHIRSIMRTLCRSFPYKKALAMPGAMRWDTFGNTVEPVSAENAAHALAEVRQVGHERSVRLKPYTGNVALFLTRPAMDKQLAWMNHCDEEQQFYLVVMHSSKWRTPARLSYDFHRQLLHLRPEDRAQYAERMRNMLRDVEFAVWLYHGQNVKLQEEEFSGQISGLDEISVHTVIERLNRKFRRIFGLNEAGHLARLAGVQNNQFLKIRPW